MSADSCLGRMVRELAVVGGPGWPIDFGIQRSAAQVHSAFGTQVRPRRTRDRLTLEEELSLKTESNRSLLTSVRDDRFK